MESRKLECKFTRQYSKRHKVVGNCRRQKCLMSEISNRLSLIITYENKSKYFNIRTLNLKSLKERKLVVT